MQISFTPINEKSHFLVVKEIYDYYILHTTVTFDTDRIKVEDLQTRILTNHPIYPSFLIKADEDFSGFCYLSPFNARKAYYRTAEITLYLKSDFLHKGIGKQVVKFLEMQAMQKGISVLIAKITAENIISAGLFHTMGYQQCAHFKKVGEKFGKILDVYCYQKILST